MKEKVPRLEDALDLLKAQAVATYSVAVPESAVVRLLSARTGSVDSAQAWWERIAPLLRKPTVHEGFQFRWNFVRSSLEISKMPTAEQLEQLVGLYEESTPRDLERRIGRLTGRQFEILMVELLGRIPKFRGIIITQLSHDGGVDFFGHYAPDANGLEWPLVGQAKHYRASLGAGDARDFIGALNTCGQKSPVGLFVCTSGFSAPAANVFERSDYQIMQWGLPEVRDKLIETGLGVRAYRSTLHLPDDVFWEEMFGET